MYEYCDFTNVILWLKTGINSYLLYKKTMIIDLHNILIDIHIFSHSYQPEIIKSIEFFFSNDGIKNLS